VAARALEEEKFITELVKDPCDVPKLVVLKGYLGKGVEVGGTQRWRVYLTHALADYYEGDDYAEDVKYWEKEPATGLTLVWVAHGTELRLVRTRGSEAELPRLLRGPVAQAYLPQAPQATGVPPAYAVQPPLYEDPGWPGGAIDPGWEGTRCGQCYSASL
jgi:hypothetical protein